MLSDTSIDSVSVYPSVCILCILDVDTSVYSSDKSDSQWDIQNLYLEIIGIAIIGTTVNNRHNQVQSSNQVTMNLGLDVCCVFRNKMWVELLVQCEGTDCISNRRKAALYLSEANPSVFEGRLFNCLWGVYFTTVSGVLFGGLELCRTFRRFTAFSDLNDYWQLLHHASEQTQWSSLVCLLFCCCWSYCFALIQLLVDWVY